MHLVELIACDGTDAGILDELERFLVTTLGKGVVRARDTPNFIANRVGVFSMLATIHHAERLGIGFDTVDALTGSLIGRPRSATFRTADVVGLDTFAHVVNTMRDTLPEDPWHKYYGVPEWLQGLIDQGALGQKSRRGVYQKVGGDIHVQSQPGQGSNFTVRLPLVPHQPESVDAAPPSAPLSITDSEKLRILVAEDHPVNQKFLAFLLQRLGHQATFCENGEIALQTLDKEDFDVVLMDIHMPVMDGLTATRAIRSRSCLKANIPIIALTADVFKEARESAAAAGVNAFIPKPVQLQELQNALNTHVKSATQEDEAALN
jgi:CheY-like chemotaxis protein